MPKLTCDPIPVGVADMQTYQSCCIADVLDPEGLSPLIPGLAIKLTYGEEPLHAVQEAEPDPSINWLVSG